MTRYDIEFYNLYFLHIRQADIDVMIKIIRAYNSAFILYDIASKICCIESSNLPNV